MSSSLFSDPDFSSAFLRKTVVNAFIVVVLCLIAFYFLNKYMADQRYIALDSNETGGFQPKGNYVTVAQYDPVIKTLKDSTDMMSQQMKSTMSVTANLLRSVGFIRISPNTVLLSTSTSGLTTGFGGLPSCIGGGSPLTILSGSPAFVNKVMAYKDAKPTSTFQEALLAAVKSIGTESFRFRRRQDLSKLTPDELIALANSRRNSIPTPISTTAPVSTTAVATEAVFASVKTPYQLQFQNNLVNNFESLNLTSLTADDKKLLSSFATKYLFAIDSFDQKTGFPIIQSTPDIFAGKQTPLSPSSSTYQTILNDIYRYNPHLLNSC